MGLIGALVGVVVLAATLLLRVFWLQYQDTLRQHEWKDDDGQWWALVHENPDLEGLERWGIEQWTWRHDDR